MEYLKSIFLGSVGIDIIKKKIQAETIIGFELFNSLLRRVIDYDEYQSRNP